MNKAALAGMGLVAIDQLFKLLVDTYEPAIDMVVFSVHKVTNTGAGFGILQGNNTLLIFVSLMAIGIIMMSAKSITKAHAPGIALITSGIASNLIDRVFRGHVIDYIDLGWWPVFNIADACIMIGAITLGVAILKEHESKPVRPSKAKSLKK